ncbi:MAG: hypothetical protein HOW73_21395 [Polyangiaceae bacterium]|nr:hypothetical protein [Polyangiaceae bacterium]
MQERARGQRRAKAARLAFILLAAATCNNSDGCANGCNSCSDSTSSVRDSLSCDCNGRPGCSGSGDGTSSDAGDGWDDDGDTTTGTGAGPITNCYAGRDSCNGPTDDFDGCETDLLSQPACGHCMRDCTYELCTTLTATDGMTCEEKVHFGLQPPGPVVAFATGAGRAYWSTSSTLHFVEIVAGNSYTVTQDAVELAGDNSYAYAITSTGDVISVEMPAGAVTVLSPGPSEARLLRTDDEYLYWFDGTAIRKVGKHGGAVEVVLDQLTGLDLRDFVVDGYVVWGAAYDPDDLGPYFFRVEVPSLTAMTLKSLGPEADATTLEIERSGYDVFVGHSYGIEAFQTDGTPLDSPFWQPPAGYRNMRIRDGWAYYIADGAAYASYEDGYQVRLFDEGSSALDLVNGRVVVVTDTAILSTPW